ncbi:MAG: isoleucine--tRNA ligase [Candidatus Micrarchaeia archaeon]
MSYRMHEIEQDITEYWKKNDIFNKVQLQAKGEKFYFCDGPPYATGSIHPGTAWNKCIKDLVCRFKRARGFSVRSQAGYDTHGLPIEHKVEQELGLKSKKEIEERGIENFIKECKKYATKYISVMSGQFMSLGVWLDFENPYITYFDEYIEKSWATIGKAWEKGLLVEGEYVLPICPRCETTMANYELEYEDRDDPSIYVKFAVEGKENEYLLIWTTTPWTLIGNRAVMVHPDYTYVKVKVDDEVWVVAKELLERVSEAVGISPIVLEEFEGKQLEGIKYIHPFQNRTCPVVTSDRFVTLEDGTGLVHCAPGHGPEDYTVGKEKGIEIYCPVDMRGRYTEGKYKGIFVKDADPLIIDELKKEGTLVYEGKIRHRYPHCWRCKTPLIFIATKQWFIAVSKLREKMLSEIERCRWQPEFAKTWFINFVSVAPDWCISRQRYWGIPLPIWVCEKCGKKKVVSSKAELGADVELHRPYIDKIKLKCECGGTMNRVKDVVDVWFDSGNAVWASLKDGEEQWYPADFIVEGKDQIRGWFYSLLGCGVVLRDAIPYLSLLMHGHFVDEKGEKMSKSLGNFVPLEEIIEKHGADAFRLWSLSSTVWEDLKFNWSELSEANSDLSVIWNIGVFIKRFIPENNAFSRRMPNYSLEDRWLVSRMNTTMRDVTRAFEDYRIHDGVRLLRKFIVEDVSRFYMKILKARMQEKESSAEQLSTLYSCYFDFLRLFSPVCPFISEKLYLEIYKKDYEKESISMHEWPSGGEADEELESTMEQAQHIIAAASNARQKANIKLRWPVREIVVKTSSEKARKAIELHRDIILCLSNAKDISVSETEPRGDYECSEFSDGFVYVSKAMTEELKNEALAREIIRRIQSMRKDANLIEKDRIKVELDGSDAILNALRKNYDHIKARVNATEIETKKEIKGKRWQMDEEFLVIRIEKTF